jgi:CHAT domain-containing protein
VRAQQDATRQIGALSVLVASNELDSQAADDLKARIDTLQRAVEVLAGRIERAFPTYAELLDPRVPTLEEARAMLRPDEALIAVLVGRDRSFVWAVSPSEPPAFVAVAIGEHEIEQIVTALRKSLDPGARILGDIPALDLAAAHRLYRALLEPARSGWQSARSLVVITNGSLGQLPLALLPTSAVTLRPEPGILFSNYRQVPWLARSHAVTMLPSVGSLATLRALPPGNASRRVFVGFGDPYFSQEQAMLVEQGAIASIVPPKDIPGEPGEGEPTPLLSLATRGVPVTFRSSPQVFDSSNLAKLPRLPDTAEEILDLARAMNADPAQDVFLGARANEKIVKTLDLTSYRVVAFATHGLVPGDLDGLAQPALALSAPDVAGVDGDGLLTMDEILALRLDADWVVLSACNTASGQGAGTDAVSGLGRAFFYAGARALLVSNWPVETTSARLLTTKLFSRWQRGSNVTRAQALQQTMNWLIDHGEFVDAESGKSIFSYAHPIFWAPFTLIGDGGSGVVRR